MIAPALHAKMVVHALMEQVNSSAFVWKVLEAAIVSMTSMNVHQTLARMEQGAMTTSTLTLANARVDFLGPIVMSMIKIAQPVLA